MAVTLPPTATAPPLVTRVMLQSYKSIARCDVTLRPLTVLVGPNGSGKSNFLDSLRFVADALNTTLDQAIRDRGGVDDVRRRSSGHPNHFGIRLELALPNGTHANYSFEIGAAPSGGFVVQREQCLVFGDEIARFDVATGRVTGTISSPPASSPDRLFLVAASGWPEFRPLYDALTGMAFYNLAPDVVREHQPPDAGDVLLRDGRNLASVVGRMETANAAVKQRLEDYVSQIVPGLEGITRKSYGARETLEFLQQVKGAKRPWRFSAASMSDGTLRAVGVLAALLQAGPKRNGDHGVTLVGIEEPEVALHPAATGVLLDALLEASHFVQVIATTHSPDLIDSAEIPTEAILAVRSEADVTQIGPVDEAGRKAVKRGLYTPGELLRSDQLLPDAASKRTATNTKRALRLFEP
jgi:predicted ATPase